MQPVGFPFLLSQNESGTTRGKMKGDKKNTHKKKKKKIPTPSSSRIIVPFQMIKKREKRKTSNSAQNNSTSLEFHMGEGENLGVSSFSLFLLFFFLICSRGFRWLSWESALERLIHGVTFKCRRSCR